MNLTRGEWGGPGTDIQVHSTVGFGNWEGKSVTGQENRHIKDNITRYANIKEWLSILLVSTGGHNNLSEFFPACITEGKADDAFDSFYIESNHLEMDFSFSD